MGVFLSGVEYEWVPVAQPLFVVRTGMERVMLRDRTTEDDWLDTKESAEGGLKHFCVPTRVYAIGVATEDRGPHVRVYLAGSYVLTDFGGKDDEVLMTGDDAVALEAKAREWVTEHLTRAKKSLAAMTAT